MNTIMTQFENLEIKCQKAAKIQKYQTSIIFFDITEKVCVEIEDSVSLLNHCSRKRHKKSLNKRLIAMACSRQQCCRFFDGGFSFRKRYGKNKDPIHGIS